ncbi:hypothetical protein KPA93_30895 [Burkholderia cenocepacia]|uniref:hypothetical protein n=1 Tax=Burkholderia cenocepacia TaxID=95486 RepID=UPI001B9A5DDD|nr:hypothetical protein [Burkholderia cenocepacia]MBR8308093.1 hypothetical protein [Burkholderia cenocepacia]MDR8027619.1 hypothetical protein [Burkholderia cenocepacia]MDR8044868.1 hypothetical protein [Burkholderia cenocepacia]
MHANPHNIASLFLAFAVLVVAILRWIRWRDAKAQGLSPAQFAVANGATSQKLRATGKQMRWVAWLLIAFPFVLGALMAAHHKGTGSLLAAEIGAFVFIFGILGLVCLWVARKNDELARQIEMLP